MNDTDQPNNNLENNIEKTIDESAMAQQAADAPTKTPPKTSIPKAYRKGVLPSGKKPVKVGSGTIVGVLGTGGMAKVYKIWNEKLEVYRAVKILLPSGGKELTSRFETEAKITAKLHHPNIVEIYNVGEWNELPYLEMEIIEGIALDTIIGKYGRLPDSVSCAIAIQISKALAYAHSQEFLLYGKTYKGIIHRDLKPANIMISKRGDLKLMDFGIARPTEVGLHTMEGHIVGTLQYLSPEQLDGVAVDKRSDIYSFGAILYEILTGTKTFPQTTMTNLMKMKATNSYRRFNEFDFRTNPALAKICEKCLHIDRNNRYESANELLDDLRKVFNSLSAEEPREILQRYIDDPLDFGEIHYKKKIPAKYFTIGGVAAALILVIILIVTLLPGKKSETVAHNDTTSGKSVTKPPEMPKPKEMEPVKPVEDKKPEEKKIALKTEPPAEKAQPTITPKKRSPRKPVTTIKKKTKKEKPTDMLQSKYGSSDPLEIGEKACKQGSYADAIKVLENAPDDAPKKSLLLLWAYLETKNLIKARKFATIYQGNDAFAELLRGRIQVALGNDRKALTYYEAAITKPSSINNPTSIRNDVLYYIALVRDNHHKKSPSPETRLQALTAWNNLKKVYSSTPNHPRFKLANKKLATTY